MSLSYAGTQTSEIDKDSKLRLSRYPSFSDSYHQRSRQDIYIHKLQGLIGQHTNKIKNNKPIIEHLNYQRKLYKRICLKQLQKLKTVDKDMIKKQYEEQINDLRQKRYKMHQMIADLNEDAEIKRNTFLMTRASFQENQKFLQKSLEQLQKEKTQYLQIIQRKKRILQLESQKIKSNSTIIRQKQRTDEKYDMVRDQIKRKEIISH